jgi:hypothetical protein
MKKVNRLEAIKDYERRWRFLLNPFPLNNLAWLLATGPNAYAETEVGNSTSRSKLTNFRRHQCARAPGAAAYAGGQFEKRLKVPGLRCSWGGARVMIR